MENTVIIILIFACVFVAILIANKSFFNSDEPKLKSKSDETKLKSNEVKEVKSDSNSNSNSNSVNEPSFIENYLQKINSFIPNMPSVSSVPFISSLIPKDTENFDPKIQAGIAESVVQEKLIPLPYSADDVWENNFKLTKDSNERGLDNTPKEIVGNGLNYNMCSRSCCFQPYKTPFNVNNDPLVAASGKNFVASPYNCNDGFNDSGCLCLEDNQADYIGARGINTN